MSLCGDLDIEGNCKYIWILHETSKSCSACAFLICLKVFKSVETPRKEKVISSSSVVSGSGICMSASWEKDRVTCRTREEDLQREPSLQSQWLGSMVDFRLPRCSNRNECEWDFDMRVKIGCPLTSVLCIIAPAWIFYYLHTMYSMLRTGYVHCRTPT